ncbi:hypothetical protein BaRGS_00026867 [Batillaria attramentaria]|uniref:EF-hand domain-containing protein n=1 Tax=Batillaria attramentaria TaxID=370345 RepID=A0ABD0K4J0_9CAEN
MFEVYARARTCGYREDVSQTLSDWLQPLASLVKDGAQSRDLTTTAAFTFEVMNLLKNGSSEAQSTLIMWQCQSVVIFRSVVSSQSLRKLNHVVDAAIAKFDSGSDHQLNETEFLSVAEGEVVNIDYLHEEFGFASAAAKAIFDVYDVDESGHLSIHEMRNLFEYLDKNAAAVPALTNNMQWQQFVTKMFEVHDQDGSGDVDKEELMELYEYLDQNGNVL